ncbi:hypothetical protein [Nocardioides baculatus]|uniref:Uncharacterized protein n=1 Tax=Nocardioides baculatus TaxID=2801337 RepID=A0ABS1LAP7_9ACTN|nr:hypothetical protein [Nocardioides baculatus]MBL0747591.1 hypothetical protein [Nocardioides baculatus]
MPRTPHHTEVGTSAVATAVAHDVIASLDHDPELYVPGTLAALPGSRTVTWRTACSTRCPHPDRRCHRSHAAWANDDRTHALLSADPAAEAGAVHAEADSRPRVPAQRGISGRA